jgi:hypothetical protein
VTAPNVVRGPESYDEPSSLGAISAGRQFPASQSQVQAFPGHGQMKPEQLEIERLRREANKLKAERDKAAAFLREGSDMKFVSIAKHRAHNSRRSRPRALSGKRPPGRLSINASLNRPLIGRRNPQSATYLCRP